MRHKPPPSPTASPAPQPTEAKQNEAGAIQQIEFILGSALTPERDLTSSQLCDLMEMFITDLHLRKVTGEFWVEVQMMCVQCIKLATRVETEDRMSRTLDLPEGVVKTVDGAIELSLQEIRSLRTQLMAKLELLMQCAPGGAKVH